MTTLYAPWPVCSVCGERHPPKRRTNGGPSRCWHCGETEARCRCLRDREIEPWQILAAVAVLCALAIYYLAK